MLDNVLFPPARGTATRLSLVACALVLAGCASQAPQGYGAAELSPAVLAQQQMDKAEQSTQVDPKQTYLNLIAQMQQANQWYASLAHTQAFERQYGKNAQSQLQRADALRNTGQPQQAQADYRALLADADQNLQARAHRGLGLLYASQRRYTQAVQHLESARQLNPIDADVLADLAYTHMLDGRLAAASVPILQASQLAPGNARVQLNMALFWLASGAQDQATQLLQRLRQPQGRNTPPLIDDLSLQNLQAQLRNVVLAVQARADADAISPAPATDPGRSSFLGAEPATFSLAPAPRPASLPGAADHGTPAIPH